MPPPYRSLPSNTKHNVSHNHRSAHCKMMHDITTAKKALKEPSVRPYIQASIQINLGRICFTPPNSVASQIATGACQHAMLFYGSSSDPGESTIVLFAAMLPGAYYCRVFDASASYPTPVYNGIMGFVGSQRWNDKGQRWMRCCVSRSH